MFYVGIDQHKRHLTICVRNEQGDVALRRQVKTGWLEVDRFLESLQERSVPEGGYVAIMEVCGFNDWLLKRLARWGCTKVYVIAAPPRLRNKTDRRDSAKLSELLWINRERIAAGSRLVEVREVYQPSPQEQEARQLTHLRQRLGREQTRTKNRIGSILRRHNLEQECPTKGLFTQQAWRWLTKVDLPPLDRIALNMEMKRYLLCSKHLDRVTPVDSSAGWEAPDGPVAANLAQDRRLHGSGTVGPHWPDYPLPPRPQSGQLLRPDAWLPELGGIGSAGEHHQGRSPDRAFFAGPGGTPRLATRCGPAILVSAGETPPRG